MFVFFPFSFLRSDSECPSLECPSLSLDPPFPSPEDHRDLSDLSLEEADLLAPSLEVSASLSVCGNIHQAQYYPFWTDVLKCSEWHKGILREGLRLDFIDGVFPSTYDERNNLSARREPAFVRDSLDSMTSSGILNHVLVKPVCVNPLTVASRDLDTGSRKLRLCWDGSRKINPMLKKMSVKLTHFPKAAELLYEGDYQVSLDLKSFYYHLMICLLYTSPSPRDRQKSRMPSSA